MEKENIKTYALASYGAVKGGYNVLWREANFDDRIAVLGVVAGLAGGVIAAREVYLQYK